MKDSAADQAAAPDQPVERPAWRFSGRRGTPVHLREEAPGTLPPEIRETVSQLARERAGEASAPEAAAPVRAASSTLDLSSQARTAPPVAGAPMPVERRTRSSSAATAVTTTPMGAIPAPPSLAPPAAPSDVEGGTPDSQRAAETSPEEKESREEAPADGQRSLTAAERRRRAKARAKSRRARTRGAGRSTKPHEEGKRRLLARGREVDAAREQVAVEPVPPTPPRGQTEPPPATPLVETPPPVDGTPPLEAAAPDLARADEPDRPRAEERTTVFEAPPGDVGGAVEREPEPPALDAAETGPAPTAMEAEPPALPEPTLARDGASQAAWELGRLPILLTQGDTDAATAPPRAERQPERDEHRDDVAIPAARTSPRMPPMAWDDAETGSAGGAPAPTGADAAPTKLPDAIARLDETTFPPPPSRRPARARAHEEGRDAAAARQRIAERRARLDELVQELATLGSTSH